MSRASDCSQAEPAAIFLTGQAVEVFLQRQDTFTGGEVLPGFAEVIAQFFE